MKILDRENLNELCEITRGAGVLGVTSKDISNLKKWENKKTLRYLNALMKRGLVIKRRVSNGFLFFHVDSFSREQLSLALGGCDLRSSHKSA